MGFTYLSREMALAGDEVQNISICGSHFWAGVEVELQPPLVVIVSRAQLPCMLMLLAHVLCKP